MQLREAMDISRKRKFNFRVGIPTIVALVIVAVLLIVFATPFKYGVERDTSDFSSLPMFSCDLGEGDIVFDLPDPSLFESTTLTITPNSEGDILTDISQVQVENNSSLFVAAGTYIKIDGDTVYIIITGFRQFLFSGAPESYGFALHINN